MKGTGPCGPSLNYFAKSIIVKPPAQRPAGLGGWRIGENEGWGKGKVLTDIYILILRFFKTFV